LLRVVENSCCTACFVQWHFVLTVAPNSGSFAVRPSIAHVCSPRGSTTENVSAVALTAIAGAICSTCCIASCSARSVGVRSPGGVGVGSDDGFGLLDRPPRWGTSPPIAYATPPRPPDLPDGLNDGLRLRLIVHVPDIRWAASPADVFCPWA